jgi:hypothetical protein
MPSSFPGAIDNFTDPLSNSALNSPSHAGQHQDLNDAVEKIETYMGLVKVIPTSVSSAGGTAATLAANGTVTVGTSNTSIDIRGCFSSLYSSYRIVWSGIAASVGGNAMLGKCLVGGTATTAGFYGNTYYVANSAAGALTNATRVNTSYAEVGNITSTYTNAGFVDIQQPFATSATYTSFSACDDFYWRIGTDILRNTTSYDGFQLSPTAGALTGGTIRVYGYRN